MPSEAVKRFPKSSSGGATNAAIESNVSVIFLIFPIGASPYRKRRSNGKPFDNRIISVDIADAMCIIGAIPRRFHSVKLIRISRE